MCARHTRWRPLHGIAPGIMGLEDGEVVRSTHALAKGVINDVAGYPLIAIWRETDGQSIADHEPGQRRRGRCACGRRRWCRDTRGQYLRSGGIELSCIIKTACSYDLIAPRDECASRRPRAVVHVRRRRPLVQASGFIRRCDWWSAGLRVSLYQLLGPPLWEMQF